MKQVRREGIDGWFWWMERSDAFLLADTAGTTGMEVINTESYEGIFFCLFGIVYIPMIVTERR